MATYNIVGSESKYWKVAILQSLTFYLQRLFYHHRLCVYIAIIAIILAVTLWRMDSVAVLKCNGGRFKSLLVPHIDQGSLHWREGSGV